jgi:hypothetical protein
MKKREGTITAESWDELNRENKFPDLLNEFFIVKTFSSISFARSFTLSLEKEFKCFPLLQVMNVKVAAP